MLRPPVTASSVSGSHCKPRSADSLASSTRRLACPSILEYCRQVPRRVST
ncbi:hypothetical protein D555_1207 [Bordetella holmesii 35009]|nr:hypothetical protein D555_1207 [Bordetella holmesii 35009]